MPVPAVTVFSVTEKEAPEARSDASLYSFQHRPRNIILNITAQRRKLVVIYSKGRKRCVLLQVPGRGWGGGRAHTCLYESSISLRSRSGEFGHAQT